MSIWAAAHRRAKHGLTAIIVAFALTGTPGVAQIERVDPNAAMQTGAIDGDLDNPAAERPASSQPGAPVYVEERPFGIDSPVPAPPVAQATDRTATAPQAEIAPSWADPVVTSPYAAEAAAQASSNPEVAAAQGDTYKEDDLIGAAEGLFGDGAKEIAGFIQDLLKDQGEPNGYIVGREAGGAFIIGARYGSGTLYHKIEGQRPVYWTGPSIGFDAGANAGNTFILVYNLYDTEELFKRFPAGEGQAYAIGGVTASYLRWGDTVLIPIRVGAGLRLGVNAGYMRFSKKQRWLPF
ncbi:MAG: EipA family protein [Pontixanthobacter sp.]